MKLMITETQDTEQRSFVIEFRAEEVQPAIQAIVSAYMNLTVDISGDSFGVVTAIAGEEVEKFAAVGIGSDGRVYGVRY